MHSSTGRNGFASSPHLIEHAEPEAREWPQRIGVLNDYVRIPYANGSSFASQMLYREFTKRGHDVVVLGPRDPSAKPHELPRQYVTLPSLPLRNHPGVYMPMPTPAGLREAEAKQLDVLLGQSGSGLLDLGVWLRMKQRVPLLCVNTIHLPSVYNVILPDRLNRSQAVHRLFQRRLIPGLERASASVYNMSDGLIVLSSGLEKYWRERGVKVPIHVIPRSVEPKIFDHHSEQDPFPAAAKKGQRLLLVCRHTREKNVERLLTIFARLIASAAPDATLTLIGDGPDHEAFKECARKLGVEQRTFFLGERPIVELPTWYRHADLFVYTSLSETYGQVVSEALWCGLPVVAFADNMGVSQQVTPETGVLIEPGPNEAEADWRFGKEVVALLRHSGQRLEMARQAEASARRRCHPDQSVARYYEAFESARRHVRTATIPSNLVQRAWPLLRWSSVHTSLVLSGCLRAPAHIHPDGREQPTWEGLLADLPGTHVEGVRSTARRSGSEGEELRSTGLSIAE